MTKALDNQIFNQIFLWQICLCFIYYDMAPESYEKKENAFLLICFAVKIQ